MLTIIVVMLTITIVWWANLTVMLTMAAITLGIAIAMLDTAGCYDNYSDRYCEHSVCYGAHNNWLCNYILM